MSLFTETFAVKEQMNNNSNTSNGGTGSSKKDELRLIVKSTHSQPSPMSESLKQRVRKGSKSLNEILHEETELKGELKNAKFHPISNTTYKVEGVSESTLHSFILRAEGLGKKITYTRTLEIAIED